MSTHLTRTTSGTPTLGTKCTVSAWIKIGEVPAGGGSDRWLFGEHDNSSNHSYLYLRNSSAIGWYETDGSGAVASIITNGLCRDLNGWFHFMVAYDTTDSTQADRIKIYINGVRQTSFSTNTNNISQNYTPRMNRTGKNIYIGGVPSYQTHFSGLMSHIHHCDGTALAPTVFGSTDSTTGEWKINASPSFTLGNNGFSILKDGNTITDQSTNSNDFTLGAGTLTKTEDCPSNVFCIFNKLYNTNANNDLVPQLTLGNTMLSGHGGSNWYQIPGTLAFNSGKFYWEAKFNAGTNLTQNHAGVIDYDKCFGTGQFRAQTGSVFFTNEDGGETYTDGSVTTADYGALAQNDILCVAVDMDAGTPTVKFYKNGTLHATVNASSLAGKFITPAQMVYGSGEFQLNFGNGYFGTTAVSSAGSNASGNGIFEYNVPAGYTALSTKGLNE